MRLGYGFCVFTCPISVYRVLSLSVAEEGERGENRLEVSEWVWSSRVT